MEERSLSPTINRERAFCKNVLEVENRMANPEQSTLNKAQRLTNSLMLPWKIGGAEGCCSAVSDPA